jgi:hypothetical protein
VTRRRIAIILTLALTAWMLTGCGHTDYPDLGQGTWSYHGHGHS